MNGPAGDFCTLVILVTVALLITLRYGGEDE